MPGSEPDEGIHPLRHGSVPGQMCGTVVSEMFAARRHAGVAAVGHYRIRPPVKPLTVGELARWKDPALHGSIVSARRFGRRVPRCEYRVSIPLPGRFESSPAVPL